MKGEAFLKQGNIEAANECFKKAVDITPRMAFNLINVDESFFFLKKIDSFNFGLDFKTRKN